LPTDTKEKFRHKKLLNSKEYLNNRNNNADYKDYLASKSPSTTSSATTTSIPRNNTSSSSSYLQKYPPSKIANNHCHMLSSKDPILEYGGQVMHHRDYAGGASLSGNDPNPHICIADGILGKFSQSNNINVPAENISNPNISITQNEVNENISNDILNNDNEFNIDDDVDDTFLIDNENNNEKDIGIVNNDTSNTSTTKNNNNSTTSCKNNDSSSVYKSISSPYSNQIDLSSVDSNVAESLLLLGNAALSSRSSSNNSTSSIKRKGYMLDNSDDENEFDRMMNVDASHPSNLCRHFKLSILNKKNKMKLYREKYRQILDEEDYVMNCILENDVLNQRSTQPMTSSIPHTSTAPFSSSALSSSSSSLSSANQPSNQDSLIPKSLQDSANLTSTKSLPSPTISLLPTPTTSSQQLSGNTTTSNINIPNNTSILHNSSNVASNPTTTNPTSIAATQPVSGNATSVTASPINGTTTSSSACIFNRYENNLPSRHSVPSKSSDYYLEHNLMSLSEIFPNLINCLLKEEYVQSLHFNYSLNLFDENFYNSLNVVDNNEVVDGDMLTTKSPVDIYKINQKQAIIENLSFKVVLSSRKYLPTTFIDREIRNINDVDYSNNVNNNIIINHTPMFRTPVVLALPTSAIPQPIGATLLPTGGGIFRESYGSYYILTNFAIRTINNQRYNSYNNNFNLNRSYLFNRVMRVHYTGYNVRSDEVVTCNSWRLRPFRLNSCRPISIPILRVNEIINSTGLNNVSSTEVACKDSIEIKLRCFWLMNRPGSGYLRIKVPITITIDELIFEYCNIMKISYKRCNACLINMEEAVQFALNRRSGVKDHPYPKATKTSTSNSNNINNSESKFNSSYLNTPGIRHLNSLLNLKSCEIIEDDTIDILYNPVDFCE
jgi:hypothetical protein